MPREELDIDTIVSLVRNNKHAIFSKYKTKEAIISLLKSDTNDTQPFIEVVARLFAKKNKLPNGQTIHYLDDDYRNHNLLFWDSQNERIVYPFYEIDDYGSVPPIFPVGDGYFNPFDWLDEVDHNTFVFPSCTLIKEMKEFVIKHPGQKKMIVQINKIEYIILYNESQMEGKWDSCILEVEAVRSHHLFFGGNPLKGNDILCVRPGDPDWRKDIVE